MWRRPQGRRHVECGAPCGTRRDVGARRPGSFFFGEGGDQCGPPLIPIRILSAGEVPRSTYLLQRWSGQNGRRQWLTMYPPPTLPSLRASFPFSHDYHPLLVNFRLHSSQQIHLLTEPQATHAEKAAGGEGGGRRRPCYGVTCHHLKAKGCRWTFVPQRTSPSLPW